ncbi:hypothetical protein ACE15K_03835 [Citrobacter farmeri]
MTTYYSRSPGLTVKISEECPMIISNTSEVKALKAEIYQFKQAVEAMKELVA